MIAPSRPAVEKMNEFAPQHSHVFKEMILVTSPDKPLTYTAKLTPRRQAIINDYAEEIEALYEAADESTQAAENTPLPEHWDLNASLSFVRSVVESVLERTVPDGDDLFQHGCDSLQATWIRNSILHTLREGPKVNTRGVSASFVYQHPTISSLAKFIVGAVQSGSASLPAEVSANESPEQATVNAMVDMAKKHTRGFPKHVGSKPLPQKDVVLVTGTTGALGATLLAALIQDTTVEHVYALNRKSEEGKTLPERQAERLKEWGLNPELVKSGKVTLLESDVNASRLGLSDSLYEQVITFL